MIEVLSQAPNLSRLKEFHNEGGSRRGYILDETLQTEREMRKSASEITAIGATDFQYMTPCSLGTEPPGKTVHEQIGLLSVPEFEGMSDFVSDQNSQWSSA